MLICENLYKIRKTIERPIAKLVLYMADKNIKAIRIKFPKPVSNKLTNRLGTANITIHNIIKNVIKPTTKLMFFWDNILSMETVIYIYILFKKKLKINNLK